MTGPTHLVGGITLAVKLGFTSPIQLAVVGIASLLPDIDVKSSLIGRMVPVLPTVLEKTVGHRTITHSIWALGLFTLLIYSTFPDYWLPFLVGYTSHLLLDIISGGIPLLYPLPKRFNISFGIPPVFAETVFLIGIGIFFAFNLIEKWT